jgi:hypothetical protein
MLFLCPPVQECVFNPKLQSKQLVKEGKALKLAATLSLCRRGQVRPASRAEGICVAPAGREDLQQSGWPLPRVALAGFADV